MSNKALLSTFIFSLISAIFLHALEPAQADPSFRRFSSEDWSFQLPMALVPLRTSTGQFAAKEEIEGPYHSIVFHVSQELSAPYEHPEHTPKQRNAELRNAITSIVDKARRSTEGERNDRVSSMSTASLPVDFLPKGEVCGGFQWEQTDEQVPGQEGRTFVTKGYQLICLGSRQESDSVELIRVLFSERYSEELGHQPKPDLDDIARRILSNVQYRRK